MSRTTYKIHLGSTILNKDSSQPSDGGGTPSKQFYAFRYSQKPQSLSTALPGLISPDGSTSSSSINSALYASFPSTGSASLGGASGSNGNGVGAGKVHTFTGTEVPATAHAGRDVECVLVWDEEKQSYALERLTSTVRLSHDRIPRAQPPLPIPSTSPRLSASIASSTSHARSASTTRLDSHTAKAHQTHKRSISSDVSHLLSRSSGERGRQPHPTPIPSHLTSSSANNHHSPSHSRSSSQTRSPALHQTQTHTPYESEVEDFGQISLTPKLSSAPSPPGSNGKVPDIMTSGIGLGVGMDVEEDYGPTPKGGREEDGSRSRSRSRVASPEVAAGDDQDDEEDIVMEEILPSPPKKLVSSATKGKGRATRQSSTSTATSKSPPKPKAQKASSPPVAASKRPAPSTSAAASKRPAAASKRPAASKKPAAPAAASKRPPARAAASKRPPAPAAASKRPTQGRKGPAPPSVPPPSTELNHAQARPRRRSSVVLPGPPVTMAVAAKRPAVALKSLPAHLRSGGGGGAKSDSDSSGSEDDDDEDDESDSEESGPEGYLAVPGSVLGRSGGGTASTSRVNNVEEEDEEDEDEEEEEEEDDGEMDWLASTIEMGIARKAPASTAPGAGGKGRGGRARRGTIDEEKLKDLPESESEEE